MFSFFNSFSQSSSNMSGQDFIEARKSTPGILIDVRTAGEYNQGHLKGTDFNLDIYTGAFQNKIASFDKNETYYLYCRTGNRSGQAARMMREAGFENVYNVGGFSNLVRAGVEANR